MDMKRRRSTEYRTRSLCICLVLCVILTVCGCSSGRKNKEDEAHGAFCLYYVSKDADAVIPVDYDLQTPDEREKSVREILDKLSQQPDSVDYRAPIQGFTVSSYKLSGRTLTIDFSADYRSQDQVREILARTAIVNTLCQIPGIEKVTFTAENTPLSDADGTLLTNMSEDQFINNSGSEIRGYGRIRLHLFFANQKGDRLVDTYRNVVYNSNIAPERLIVEQVLKGPNSDAVYPTLNKDTKVLSVTTRDGVCYVNLDSTFLTEPYNVTPQVAVYSLVNSLTQLPTVSKVQFSVEGKTADSFMEIMSLQNTYEENTELTSAYEESGSSEQ